MPRFTSLLDDRHSMLLQAALGEGTSAAVAYRAWRAAEKLDDTDDTVYRIMPLLVATAESSGIDDPDLARMRGAAKHIWLSNMLRIKQLAEALAVLQRAGIDALLIKGGALFARNEQFAATRVAGDYDLLVRRPDAARAIDVLVRNSFETPGMRTDLFAEADFDHSIHAVHLARRSGTGTIDLHWRALPKLYDDHIAGELFGHAELAKLAGQKVRIPCRADHLFLAVARCEPWDIKETFLRSIEAAQLLRDCGGQLDWDRFEQLVAHYRMGWIASRILRLLRDDLDVPIPDGVVERIWRRAAPGKTIENRIRSKPPAQRSPWQRWILSFLTAAHAEAPQRLLPSLLHFPGRLQRAFFASRMDLPVFQGSALRHLWAAHAAQENSEAPDGPAFVRGFSFPEDGGRWTADEYATIEIGIKGTCPPTVPIALRVVPYLTRDANAFAFEIMAGAAAPLKHVLRETDPLPAELTFDATVVGTARRKIVIALRLTGARSPSQSGHSTDPRLLGLFVQNIDILRPHTGLRVASAGRQSPA